MNYRAFVFDLDGVLVNTEPLAFKAWQQVVNATGIRMSGTDYQAMIGMDSQATAIYISHLTGLDLPPEEMIRDHWGRVLAIIDAELEPYPCATGLLSELKRRGCRLAVASNSPTDYVLHVLEKVRLRAYFQAIIGRDQVQNGKPAPDVYLEAASRIDCIPQDCVAVEDSTFGLQSAVSAGMRCLAITPDGDCKNGHSQAYACFRSLEDLYQKIDVAFKP